MKQLRADNLAQMPQANAGSHAVKRAVDVQSSVSLKKSIDSKQQVNIREVRDEIKKEARRAPAKPKE